MPQQQDGIHVLDAPAGNDTGDTSPLLSRRAWIGLAWTAFTAATAVALAATGRFVFSNVLNEPPQQFKAGFPSDYGTGVDERWKDKFGVWLVRTRDDVVQQARGSVPAMEAGSASRGSTSKDRGRVPWNALADDGPIVVDKSRRFQFELGQWAASDSFLRI